MNDRKSQKLFKKRESKKRSQASMKIEIKTRTKIKIFYMRRECSLILKKICIFIIIISVCGELDFLFFFLFQFFSASFSILINIISLPFA